MKGWLVFEKDRKEAVGKGITFKKSHAINMTRREVNKQKRLWGSQGVFYFL